MKTFRTILLTAIGMIVAAVIFLFNTGIVTIERRDVSHSEIVIRDGEVQSERYWSDLVGCEVKVDVVDGVVINWK